MGEKPIGAYPEKGFMPCQLQADAEVGLEVGAGVEVDGDLDGDGVAVPESVDGLVSLLGLALSASPLAAVL